MESSLQKVRAAAYRGCSTILRAAALIGPTTRALLHLAIRMCASLARHGTIGIIHKEQAGGLADVDARAPDPLASVS